MNYQIGDKVTFYHSSCEKALEVERQGFIIKVNKKTYKIQRYEIVGSVGFKYKLFIEEKLIRKDLVKNSIPNVDNKLFYRDSVGHPSIRLMNIQYQFIPSHILDPLDKPKPTIQEMKIEILEIFESLVEKGIWNENIYLQEVNSINDMKEKDLPDILFYLKK